MRVVPNLTPIIVVLILEGGGKRSEKDKGKKIMKTRTQKREEESGKSPYHLPPIGT